MRTSIIAPERVHRNLARDNDGDLLQDIGRIQHSNCTLHESTTPQAISDAQRREVRRYLDRFPKRSQPTIEQIADALDLPVYSVRLRLKEIGKAVAEVAPAKTIATVMHEWLKLHGPATVKEIEKAIGSKPGKVANQLNHWKDKYRKSSSGKTVKWSVV